MNCKNLICFLILTLVVLSCAFSGCLGSDSSDNSSNVSTASNESATTNTSAAANTSNATNTSTTANTSAATNTSTANSSKTSKSTGPAGISEAEFKAAVTTTRYSFISDGRLPIRNMDAEYNQSSNTITIGIIVSDSTNGDIAKYMADATLKVLNAEVSHYNHSIKLSDSTDYSANYSGRYHGGLYDECNVIIAVAPISHAGNSDYYYVSQYIPAGSHNPIYRLR